MSLRKYYEIHWKHLSLIIIMLFTHHSHQALVPQRHLTFTSLPDTTRTVCVVHACIFLRKSAWPCCICRGQRTSLSISLCLPSCLWQGLVCCRLPCMQASWPSSFQRLSCPSPLPSHRRSTGVTEVCYCAQLHLGSGLSNSGPFTESTLPTEPRTVNVMSLSLLSLSQKAWGPTQG